ncbi:acyltransferase [Gordonia sp. TBRC 11910]|uniref:Acyltransferase n=1 Tax=Gordonia asplenii TaxID=2725283 RepID=A0A848KSL2_9ACTN|nr:C45 family autoproteolytic acyltransferase/hydolase [Gordonia asplenii]NMO01944.1 acyltransferase [Gordonia asplenii]
MTAPARRFRSRATEPTERGIELGTAHGTEIRTCIAAYQRLFDDAAGTAVDLEYWGSLAWASITACAPALAREIAGIASGARVSVNSVAAINARTEILAAVGATTAGECSTVVALHDDAAPTAVQAWDWYSELAQSWFVWEIPHADGRLTTTVTEYGIVGKIGVNDRGLGVHFNILHHDADGVGIGAPVHVLARKVLDDAADLNQALLTLAAASVSASSSLTLVAARDGESAAVSVELNPAGVGYALPDSAGLLVHTNHFLQAAAAQGHDTELRNGPDTVVRYDMLRRRLAGRHDIGVNEVVAALNSHLLGGGATCCHPDRGLPATSHFATLATVVLDVEHGTLAAHDGGPCTFESPAPEQFPATEDPTTEHTETTMLKLKRIDNMDILTTDVDRLVEFYHGTLGLGFHLPYEKDEEWAAIDMGNLTLYIFKSEVGEHAPRRTAINADNAPGYDSIAFEIENLDEAVSELDGKVEWVDEEVQWKHPSGAWYRYRPFFDPDGNMLYVTEPHRADA